MTTKVVHTQRFSSRLKRLARRFPSVLDEVEALTEELRCGERPGEKYRGMGKLYIAYGLRTDQQELGKVVDSASPIMSIPRRRSHCLPLRKEKTLRI